MWGSFLDKGKELAEKAKRAAEALDRQLDETVGIQQPPTVATTTTTPIDDDALQWNDDDVVVDDDNPKEQPMHTKDEDGWDADEEEIDLDTDSIKEPSGLSVEPDSEVTIDQPHHQQQQEDEEEGETKEEHISAIEPKQPEILETALESLATETENDIQQNDVVTTLSDQVTEPENAVPQEQHHSGGGFWGVPSLGSAILGDLKQLTQQQQQQTQDTSDEAMIDDTVPITHQQQQEEEDDANQESMEPTATEEVEQPLEDKEAPYVTDEGIPMPETDNLQMSLETEPSQSQQSLDLVTETTTLHTENASAVPCIHPNFNDQDNESHQPQQSSEDNHIWEQKVQELQNQLAHREEQLVSKTEQMTMMESMFETEKQELLQKIQSTKDEAKRRIQKAKERVEAMEQRLKDVTASQSAGAEDAQKQAEIIAALREEGEKLARRQMDMEAAVRAAKGETRELREQLEEMEASNLRAEEKIVKLEADLKTTREDLASARRGESQADKLDAELRSVREESEKRAATILSLELEVKELKASQKELRKELQETQKGAAVETMQEIKKLQKEHGDLVSDLEAKIRTTEREAAVREDALRHEVDELRKRWQDAVRRADALSVDVQSSTAPLLRQLESTNKQHRARAAAWAELETQLRAELEENVIQNEKLSKERSEWKTKCARLERMNNEYESELKQLKSDLRTKASRVETLEQKITEMEVEGAKMKEEWAEVERLANEGVSRVRSEMSKTVVEAEERHRMQLDSLESQLKFEREQRTQLEQQVEGLLEKVGMFVPENISAAATVPAILSEPKPKALLQSESQIEILSGALGGIGGDDDESSDDEDEGMNGAPASGASSFAALEQLTSRLKAAKVELATLRDRLSESERTREELVQSLAESRNAREKLPLFEAKVKELSAENDELRQEVEGLREDIMDVKNMYRTQLNVLLEEKAAWNGKGNESAPKSADGHQVEDHTFDETAAQEADQQ